MDPHTHSHQHQHHQTHTHSHQHQHSQHSTKIHDLESAERRKLMPPEALLKLVSIQTQDTIVDLGAGTGYFSIPAAKMTTEKVVAIDSDAKMLEILQEKKQEQGLENLTPMPGKIEDIPLDDNAADVVIASLVLHELKSLPSGLEQIFRILKIGGRFLCIELDPQGSPVGAPRIASENMERALSEAGFTVLKSNYVAESTYALVATKVET